MDHMKRYAVYFSPRPGAFANRAAAWLGWDAALGQSVPQPELPGLPAPVAMVTSDPRKYGFHGTIRAPFRLGEGVEAERLFGAVASLANRLPPARCDGLHLQNLHGFLALTPMGDPAALMTLAATVTERTDDLRAPMTEAEIARRRPEQLSPRQRQLLDLWGYPYVMEEFQFHLTLTNHLPDDQAETVAGVLRDHFAPVLPNPFVIEDLCVFGEDMAGRFHLLHRYALSG